MFYLLYLIYHVIEGLLPWPDIAHNVFEGLAVDIVLDILHVLVEEKCVTLQKVNIRIRPF